MITLTLTEIWNNSLNIEKRQPKERDYVYSSELWKPHIDRYLAMRGVEQSNHPNIRSLRKMNSGNIWEYIASIVLNQLGIIQQQQTPVLIEDTPIAIHGRIDYLIGGVPDYAKGRAFIQSMAFDKEMNDRFMKVIENFENTIGHQELKPIVHEIKSCSEYVIDKILGGGCIEGHRLQTYSYLKALNMDEGVISYISKNDSLMAEVKVMYPDKQIEEQLFDDLSDLKGYLDRNEQPPALPLVEFDGKFKRCFEIEYSNFLTLIYGFETPEDYRNAVSGKVASYNRVLKRLQDSRAGKTTPSGKPIELTKKNLLALDEMKADGFNPDELVKKAHIEEEEEDAA